MIKRLLYDEGTLAVGAVKMVPLDMRTKSLQWVDLNNPGLTRELKLCVPTFNGFRILQVDNIIFCKAESSYTIIHLTAKKSIMLSKEYAGTRAKPIPARRSNMKNYYQH